MQLLQFLPCYVSERGLTAESERQLRMSVNAFIRFLERSDISLSDLSHSLLNAWQDANPEGWAPKTMHRRINDVLGVWSYAYAIEETENEPKRLRIRFPRIPHRIPDAWTLDELRTMLDACGTYDECLPNGIYKSDVLRATIYCGFYTALRPSDLLSLERSSLRPNGSPICQAKKHGSQLLVTVPPWLIDFLNDHYPPAVRRAVGWPYARPYFYDLWKSMLRRAGMPYGKREGLQKLRRTAVSHGEAIAKGYGSQLAGHADTRTTRRHYEDPRISRAVENRLPDIRPDDDGPNIIRIG